MKRHASTRKGSGGREVITAAVPGKRLGWLKRELDAAGVPYQVERVGDGYHVHTLEQAAPEVDGVLGYRAKGARKPSWLQRLKSFTQRQIYFAEEMVVLFGAVAALIAGVKFYGLGNLDPSFAILFKGGADLPLLRAVSLLVVAVVVLFALNKTVGKPPDGAPRGTMTHRFLSVLLIGALVVALCMAWAGKL